MKSRPKKLYPSSRIKILGLIAAFIGIFFNCSTLEAQSNKDLLSALNKLNNTLIATTTKLNETLGTESRKSRAVDKSNSSQLKTDIVGSLSQLKADIVGSLEELEGSLTEVISQLDTIGLHQNRKINSNQLYCNFIYPQGSWDGAAVSGCYLANNFGNRLSPSVESIQADGWHLTSLSVVNFGKAIAVYSKYDE